MLGFSGYRKHFLRVQWEKLTKRTDLYCSGLWSYRRLRLRQDHKNCASIRDILRTYAIIWQSGSWKHARTAINGELRDCRSQHMLRHLGGTR